MRKFILAALLMVGVAAPMTAQSELSVYAGVVTTGENQAVVGTNLALPVIGTSIFIVPDVALQGRSFDIQGVTTNLSVQLRVQPLSNVRVYTSVGAGVMHSLTNFTEGSCEGCNLLVRSPIKPVVEYGLIFSRSGNNMAFRIGHNMVLDEVDWFSDNVVQHRFTAGLDWTL